jgi:hypothetical protein
MTMKNSESIKLTGYSRIRAWKPGVIERYLENGYSLNTAMLLAEKKHGALVFESEVKNLIVSAGLALVGDLLTGDETTGLTYHAIGTSSTTPVSADTVLGAEVARKTWTSKTRSGSTIYLSEFYLKSESAYNIKEAGVFGGAAASATPDSGTLFSHYLQTYDNSAGLRDLTFEYSLEVNYA